MVDTDGNKWTRFDSGGTIGGIEGTIQIFVVPTNLVQIHVGPGRGMSDRHTFKNSLTIDKSNIPASLGTTFFQKKYKDQNDRIGKIYRFQK